MTDSCEDRQAWTAFQWAKAIKSEYRKTVESVLVIGRMLLAAKEMLPHGEFQHIFVDLPFDRRTAELYMSIARNTVLSNAKYVSHLPSTVSVLYELSRLPESVLEAALSDGTIPPNLRREDARKLFKPHPSLKTWSLATAEERLRYAINAEVRCVPAEDRESIIAVLLKLIDELKEAQDPSRKADVQAAREELEIRDSEPGGYVIFADESAAFCHPGAPAVISGVKSTHADWYRGLTTKADGVTPLCRKMVDRRLVELEAGCLWTRKTRLTYEAVLIAITGRARQHPYGGFYRGFIL
ncbi:MAG: hypothetical protein OJF50_000949 [Nitrospira sp.]|jgi:hypothetical protein|nr:hypothetical protein [Nitrospira sp.]